MFPTVVFALIIVISPTVETASDPEASMSAIDMIRYWGYPVEVHNVTTADGYILDLFRIPHGRLSDSNTSCQRPVVLMSHGLGAGAVHFFVNPPASSAAFILADAGFDVFMINHRGTRHGRRHKNLTEWDSKFWQFTFNEFSAFDATASIDMVLQTSGQSAFYWIGHSQGATVGFMTLAGHPEYNSNVKALFQLGPFATGSNFGGPLRIGVSLLKLLKPVVEAMSALYRHTIGAHEIIFDAYPLINFIARFCGAILTPEVCSDVLYIPIGRPAKTFNASRTSVYASHFPSGISDRVALHFLQLVLHDKVEHMDYNREENMRRYGSESVPRYNYSEIIAPVYMFTSQNDWFTSEREIESLVRLLPNGTIKEIIEIPDYNHFDYTFATDCAEKVFNPIAKKIRSKERDMCKG